MIFLLFLGVFLPADAFQSDDFAKTVSVRRHA
jgi:hypothetical protein